MADYSGRIVLYVYLCSPVSPWTACIQGYCCSCLTRRSSRPSGAMSARSGGCVPYTVTFEMLQCCHYGDIHLHPPTPLAPPPRVQGVTCNTLLPLLLTLRQHNNLPQGLHCLGHLLVFQRAGWSAHNTSCDAASADQQQQPAIHLAHTSGAANKPNRLPLAAGFDTLVG